MNTTEILREKINSGAYDDQFRLLYPNGTERQKVRYLAAIDAFESLFGGGRQALLISAPGRSELGGNHTDHQNGRTLACSVSMDNLAVVSPSGGEIITVKSEGYEADVVRLSELSIREEETDKSAALVRGIAAWFSENEYALGGFDAYTVSDVPKGSGLSSSACFEVLIGNIINTLFCGGAVSAVDIARAGRYAENVYFKKPSGLLDQTASSAGGIISIDFCDPEHPEITEISGEALNSGYSIIIVNAKEHHADLSEEYASIPRDMKSVAYLFGKSVLREVEPADFFGRVAELRGRAGDKAVLRAFHFFMENERVRDQIRALKDGRTEEFLRLMRQSGNSSGLYLENLFAKDSGTRGIQVALAASDWVLAGRGAARIQGGGFGGTIIALVRDDAVLEYTREMEALFGADCWYKLTVRPVGGYCFSD